MEKSIQIKFIKSKFSIYLCIIEYNNKPDIEVKIEIIKIYKIN